VPFMGDRGGDGVDTPGLYRQSDGFVYLRNSNSDGWADVEFFFGRSGDIPVVGDFDGDGVDTVSVYRPSTGKFYIKNKLKDGWADYEFVFGRPGDVPFAGDWDGDEVDSVGLRRPSNGLVYLRNKNSAGWADHEFFYGKAGDVVFAGDWNGDGKDSIGLYRPSNGFIYLSNQGDQKKLQAMISTKDDFSYGDLYELGAPDRLILQLGDNLSFIFALSSTYVGNSVDNPVNEMKVEADRVRGTLKMPPKTIFRNEPFSFTATVDAAILTPSTRITR